MMEREREFKIGAGLYEKPLAKNGIRGVRETPH